MIHDHRQPKGDVCSFFKLSLCFSTQAPFTNTLIIMLQSGKKSRPISLWFHLCLSFWFWFRCCPLCCIRVMQFILVFLLYFCFPASQLYAIFVFFCQESREIGEELKRKAAEEKEKMERKKKEREEKERIEREKREEEERIKRELQQEKERKEREERQEKERIEREKRQEKERIEREKRQEKERIEREKREAAERKQQEEKR